MKHLPIDPAEMALRRNRDFIASQKMIGEGAPVYDCFEEDGPVIKKRQEQSDFGEEELPCDYQ